jgi:hypothetical protein
MRYCSLTRHLLSAGTSAALRNKIHAIRTPRRNSRLEHGMHALPARPHTRVHPPASACLRIIGATWPENEECDIAGKGCRHGKAKWLLKAPRSGSVAGAGCATCRCECRCERAASRLGLLHLDTDVHQRLPDGVGAALHMSKRPHQAQRSGAVIAQRRSAWGSMPSAPSPGKLTDDAPLPRCPCPWTPASSSSFMCARA